MSNTILDLTGVKYEKVLYDLSTEAPVAKSALDAMRGEIPEGEVGN